MAFEKFTEEEQRIFNRFPKLFRQADLPCNKTCMCWGLELPEGWYPIIERLSEKIEEILPEGITLEYSQIKEKFNELRVYYDIFLANESGLELEELANINSKISKLIQEAEDEAI